MAGRFIPSLETELDRKNEIEVLDQIASKYSRITYNQTIKFKRYDADLFVDKKLYAITEIKCRKNICHDRFATAIIRVDKWQACKKIAKELYVKFFIIFRYTDGIFYLNETNTNKDQDGRYIGYIAPKNNPFGEKEQVIYFPVKLLKKIV